MDLKIIEKKEQPMLSRIEVIGKLEFKGPTPSEADVKKQLSTELKVGEELIVIKKISTHFGSESADLFAYSYLNKEDLKKIEPKPKEKKAKAGAPKEGGTKAPKEAPKEAPKKEKKEAPKEEKKEAPKEEKKKEAPKEEGK